MTSRAQPDLRRVDAVARRGIVEALAKQLAADPPPDNADIKALHGAEPWLRLRVGDC